MAPVIRTLSGRLFNFLDPWSYDYSIEEIAAVLSRIGRFNNHTLAHYSVAQHSVLVSRLCELRTMSPMVAMQGLMHDAAEAYVQDIVSPLKHRLDSDAYENITLDTETAIAAHFRIATPFHDAVKQADMDALWAEIRDLMNHDHDEALWPQHTIRLLGTMVEHEPLLHQRIMPLDAPAAKRLFLDRFAEISLSMGVSA